MLALNWRCDGSDGIAWHLRGIDTDGAFYGEIRYQSDDEARRRAALVSGWLSRSEAERMAELVVVIRHKGPTSTSAGRCFATLLDRSRTSHGDARQLFGYHPEDEVHSAAARAFLELVCIVDRHLSPHYAKITEPGTSSAGHE